MTAVFSFLVAEPVIDRAVRLEGAHDTAHGAGHAGTHEQAAEQAEVFSRSVQHAGLAVSSLAAGVALGVLFAVVYALVHRPDLDARPWERSLWLAGSALTGVWLLPFVRDPADPPGAGSAGDMGLRTASWLGAMAVGVGAVVLAWMVARRLRHASRPMRQGAVVAVLTAGLGVLYLLPADRGADEIPGELLWDFRLVSAASSVLLWTALGAAFGLLGVRSARSGPRPVAETPAGSPA